VEVVTEEDDHVFVDRAVVAAGIWTEELLLRSGYPKLGISVLGGSSVLGVPRKELSGVRTHVWAPYKHVSMRPWGDGQVQIGSTLVKGQNDEPAYERMLEHIRLLWPHVELGVRLRGYRPVGPDGRVFVDRIAPGILAAVGGARVGLLLAGGVARRVEELL
jgi:glycine/D-amino acid oxidase-like deaminating enzyme